MAFVSDDLLKRLFALTNETPPARWLVAYSGGIDSTVLLHALSEVRHNIPILAIHIDHGLDSSSEAPAPMSSAVAIFSNSSGIIEGIIHLL